MLTALRKYTGTLGMETPPLKASFSIFEINKFGAGTQFSYLFWGCTGIYPKMHVRKYCEFWPFQY